MITAAYDLLVGVVWHTLPVLIPVALVVIGLSAFVGDPLDR